MSAGCGVLGAKCYVPVLGAWCLVLGALCLVPGAALAQGGMLDAPAAEERSGASGSPRATRLGGVQGAPPTTMMSGLPLPAPELPAGTVTVRVVRGSITNNVPDHTVELTAGGARREAATDASGRAAFSGLQPGAQVQAFTTIDGVRLASQVITMPAQGGVRVMLAAPPEPTEPTEPIEPTEPVFSGDSRFIVEHGDESLHVFYVLEIVNPASAAADSDKPLIFDLPSGATGATILEGSTAQATVGGSRVTVTGPFAPGTTPLQIAFELPYRGSRVTIAQRLPAALSQFSVAGETTGGVTITSPLMTASREMHADGKTFMVGNGPGIAAGGEVLLTFDNLPHHPRWPRFAALGLAVAIMAAGLVIGFSRRTPVDATGRKALAEARAARFGELAALEARRRDGHVTAETYAAERGRLIAALEDIYAALDGREHA